MKYNIGLDLKLKQEIIWKFQRLKFLELLIINKHETESVYPKYHFVFLIN